MADYRIEKYDPSLREEWDDFVLNRSVNGTFLQTKNFLDYHPEGRFTDDSLMVYQKGRLIAVCPACVLQNGASEEFFSHKGSTFGGPVIKSDYYTAERVTHIIKTLDAYLETKYSKATFKITPGLFSKDSDSLLQYCMEYCGYTGYSELNTYIDLQSLPEDIIDAFDRNKLRNIRKCMEHNLSFREIRDREELAGFHDLLTVNLSKYGVTPIHTLDDICDFAYSRIPGNVKFYGVFDGNIMRAAGMMFVFGNDVIHAQNLSADYTFEDYSAITYLYYKVIDDAKKSGFKKLTWGVSTENQGKTLNFGLIRNKESYGSKHAVNKTYYKEF